MPNEVKYENEVVHEYVMMFICSTDRPQLEHPHRAHLRRFLTIILSRLWRGVYLSKAIDDWIVTLDALRTNRLALCLFGYHPGTQLVRASSNECSLCDFISLVCSMLLA